MKANESVCLPNIYISCGTNDFIYKATNTFCQQLDELKVPYKYSEEAAEHSWEFWDKEIVHFLNWIETLMND